MAAAFVIKPSQYLLISGATFLRICGKTNLKLLDVNSRVVESKQIYFDSNSRTSNKTNQLHPKMCDSDSETVKT